MLFCTDLCQESEGERGNGNHTGDDGKIPYRSEPERLSTSANEDEKVFKGFFDSNDYCTADGYLKKLNRERCFGFKTYETFLYRIKGECCAGGTDKRSCYLLHTEKVFLVNICGERIAKRKNKKRHGREKEAAEQPEQDDGLPVRQLKYRIESEYERSTYQN